MLQVRISVTALKRVQTVQRTVVSNGLFDSLLNVVFRCALSYAMCSFPKGVASATSPSIFFLVNAM
jgi:hypothetical protein